MKNQLSVLFLVFILFHNPTRGQSPSYETDSAAHVPTFIEDIESGWQTGIKVFSAPLSFDGKDWLVAGSVVTATTVAYFIDESSRDFWQRNQSSSMDKILNVGEFYGEVRNAAIISGALYLGGKIAGSRSLSITGRMLIEGLVYAGLTTTLIKYVSGRSRPYTNDGHNQFNFFETNEAYLSFPSGHCTVAFTLSSILAGRINNVYASIGLYTLAASTVVQRMYSDNHWFSDTVLGASIGYFIGKAVLMYDNDGDPDKLSLNPYYIPGGMGVSVSLLIN